MPGLGVTQKALPSCVQCPGLCNPGVEVAAALLVQEAIRDVPDAGVGSSGLELVPGHRGACLLSHGPSLIKHNFKNRILKNFKTETAEH